MNKLQIDESVKAILFFLLLSQLFFVNGMYLVACVAVFYIGFYNLQQPHKPGIFTLIFIYHFLQIIAGVWLSVYLDDDINFRSPFGGSATIINLIGLVIMFAPIIYYHHKLPQLSRLQLLQHANELSINKSFYAYIAAFFIASTLQGLRFMFEGFTEVIVSIVIFKWVFFLLFAFQSILKNKRRKELYFFIGFEFVSGIGFFSEFKTVMFYLLVIYLTLLRKITIKQVSIWAGIGVFTLSIALFWTTVKNDYRSFVNKGQRTQTVNVSQNEAIGKLYELSNTKSQEEGINSAPARFLDRLQATYHFSKAMEQVPYVIPYQNGKNWMGSFEYVFTPRLFNPDKPIGDASIKASKYTGIQYAGFKEGVSFSLGYFGDAYIDFGAYGMMIILFFLGLFYARTYFYFLKNSSKNYIYNYSLTVPIFMQLFALETDNTYLIGRLFVTIIVFFLAKKFLFGMLFNALSEPTKNAN